jgi:hypothetical protein
MGVIDGMEAERHLIIATFDMREMAFGYNTEQWQFGLECHFAGCLFVEFC